MAFEITYFEMVICITVAWIIARLIVAVRNKKFDVRRELMLLTVYLCIVVIFRFVYFPMGHDNGKIAPLRFESGKIFPLWLNLIPAVHLFDVYEGWLLNITGNILMFVPVGIFWPMCFSRLDTAKKTILAGAGFTFLIEISQLPFFDRCSDIDDLLLNTTGVVIGAFIFFGVKKLRKRSLNLHALSGYEHHDRQERTHNIDKDLYDTQYDKFPGL